MSDRGKLQKILEVIRDEILPLTESEAQKGNGVVGGAILRSDTLTSVMIGSNSAHDNPLMHGEMDTLMRFFKLPVHPDPSELIFVATHDPCPMCISALAIAGFKEIWVLYGAKDEHAGPCEQINIEFFRELFGVEGAKAENAHFTKRLIKHAVPEGDDELHAMLAEIDKRYIALNSKTAGTSAPEPASEAQA